MMLIAPRYFLLEMSDDVHFSFVFNFLMTIRQLFYTFIENSVIMYTLKCFKYNVITFL